MGRHRRTTATNAPGDRNRGAAVLRTGLLGVSAAVAMGVVAVTSGVLPGGNSYSVGGDEGSDRVRTASLPPSDPAVQGRTGEPASTAPAGPDEGDARHLGGAPASGPASAHSPSGRAAAPAPHTTGQAEPGRSATPNVVTKAPSGTSPTGPGDATTLPSGSPESAAEAEVLTLVNQARKDAGCSALRADGQLADLAGAFSNQMADEDFFDHTDPEGHSPWDRAAKAGITDLGGENIARGQDDAAAVMHSWLASPGHRANILNCDYETIGVGVHFGAGGPWWTQDFGF